MGGSWKHLSQVIMGAGAQWGAGGVGWMALEGGAGPVPLLHRLEVGEGVQPPAQVGGAAPSRRPTGPTGTSLRWSWSFPSPDLCRLALLQALIKGCLLQ